LLFYTAFEKKKGDQEIEGIKGDGKYSGKRPALKAVFRNTF
jgi:hypothetical protein